MKVLFTIQKFFTFMRVHLLTIVLNACAIDFLTRKSFIVTMNLRLFPTFSPIRFRIFNLMLRSFVHMELRFMQCDKDGSICIILHDATQFDQHNLLKMFSFFQFVSGFILKNQVSAGVCMYASVSTCFHWSACLFLYQYCTFKK